MLRNETNIFTLPSEIWLHILSFLSKRDIYTFYFVSSWLNKLTQSSNSYSKAPGPWPKRNYSIFKDDLTLKFDSWIRNIFTFENGDIIYLTMKKAGNNPSIYTLHHLDQKYNANTLTFSENCTNVLWIKNHEFAIVHDQGVTKWDVNTQESTHIFNTSDISHSFKVNERTLLLGLETGKCLTLDIEHLEESTQIDTGPLTKKITDILKYGNHIIIKYDDCFATLSDMGIFQSLTPFENIQPTLFQAYIKQKISSVSNNLAQVQAFEAKFEGSAFFKLDFNATPGYAFATKLNSTYLINLLTFKSLHLGNSDQIYLTGCLSNNDMFIAKRDKTLDCMEIHFKWNPEKNIFENSCFYPQVNGKINFGADQLLIFQPLPRYHQKAVKFDVDLFDFKHQSLRHLSLDLTNPYNNLKKEESLSESFEFYPLNENYIIGYRKTTHFDPCTYPPLRIWDNKTGSPVYFNDVTRGKNQTFGTTILPDGNIAINKYHKAYIVRFGMFNTFDQSSQQTGNPTISPRPPK